MFLVIKSEIKQAIFFGIPLVIAQLIRVLITITGVYVVGSLGILSLAASGLASSYFLVVSLFGYGALFSIAMFAGHAVGSKNCEALSAIFVNAAWFCFLMALPIAVLMWAAPTILLALGEEPQLIARTVPYFDILGLVIFVSFWVGGIQQFLMALGRAKINYVFSIILLLCSVTTFYFLIPGHFHIKSWGLGGLACGFLVANTVTLIVGLIYLLHLPAVKHLSLFKNIFRVDFSRVNELFQIGWPVGLSMTLELGAVMAIVVMLGWLGHVPLAAYQIVWQLVIFAVMIPLGLSQAISIIISRYQGASDHHRVRIAGLVNIFFGVVLVAILSIIYVVFSDWFIRLFINPAETDAAAVSLLAHRMIAISAVVLVFDSLRITASGALRGLRDVKAPLIFTLLSYWVVGIPLAVLLGFYFHAGALGLWVGLGVPTVILGPWLLWRFWRQSSF